MRLFDIFFIIIFLATVCYFGMVLYTGIAYTLAPLSLLKQITAGVWFSTCFLYLFINGILKTWRDTFKK